MLTARCDFESVETAQKSGISFYLVKPFTADALQAKIVSAVRKTPMMDALPRHP